MRIGKSWAAALAVSWVAALTHHPAEARTPHPATATSRGRLQRAAATVESADPQPSAPTPGPSGAPPASTFEDVLGKAELLEDLQTLLIAPTGGCDDAPSPIERARCEGTRAFLRRTLPGRSYWTLGDDPLVLRVGDYDPDVKGYRVSVAGCLACSKPLGLGGPGPAGQRFVTLRTPAAPAAASDAAATAAGAVATAPRTPLDALRGAVELNRSTVGFDTESEAQSWWADASGNLQVQFVFQPTVTEWTAPAGRGVSLPLLGFRVFNRCTREVLVSRPPSTNDVEMAVAPDCLERNQASRNRRGQPAETELEESLSARDLSAAMAAIRPQVAACYSRYQVPGRALLDYVVASNGTVQSVRLSGIFTGTPTGACVMEAARGARFPKFATVRQQFSYPFFLRAE
jgi:hypothetical protein